MLSAAAPPIGHYQYNTQLDSHFFFFFMASSLRLSISLDSNPSNSIPTRSNNPNPKPQFLRGSNRVHRKPTSDNLKFTHATKNTHPSKADNYNNVTELTTEHRNAISKCLETNDTKTQSFYNTAVRALSMKQDWEGAEKLLQQMISVSKKPSLRVFNTLIYASSKRGLVALTTKWFRMMLNCGVTPNTATFGMIMGLYRKGCNIEEAESALLEMRRLGIICELAYSSMITIYTRLGLYQKAERVIDLMKREEVVLNLENWLVILNVYCQQGKMLEAEKVLVRMEELGFCPNDNVVANNTMITGYGKASSMEVAEKVFVKMTERDETSYRSMIEGWGRADNYEKARWYYKELKRLGYMPNSSNLYTMMKLEAKHGGDKGSEMVGIGTLLEDMVQCGCQYSSIIGTLVHLFERAGKVYEVPRLLKVNKGSFYQHVLVNQSCCSTVVMAYVKNGLVDDAVKVLSEKKWRDSRFEDNLYHLLICSCKEAGLLEDAVRIYEQMAKKNDENKKPNKHIMCTMIDIYSIMGLFKDAEMMYLQLKASSPDSMDMIAFSIVVKMYVRAGSLEDACSVLDEIDNRPEIVPDIFLLRDMLRIYQRCNKVDKLALMYNKISKDRVSWDQELYNCVLNCCAQALPVDELSRVFDEMLQRGFVPNTITYNVMLDVFGKAKLFRKVRRLYYMAKKQGLVDVITYNTIIAAYGKNKDLKNMSSTIQKMQLHGFSVSLEAYNSMLDAYGKDGQMETFRSVLQMMKESECASDHYTYNTMINIYGEQGWIEQVADVLSELKQGGLGPDLCSYNTLIKAYGIAGMVEDAVGLIKEMRKNGIEPDKKTYTNLITALHRNDKYLEAVKWSLWMKQMKI